MLNQLMIRQVRQRLLANGLPVAIELWNGEQLTPKLLSPRVRVRLHRPASLKAFVKPSLGALARAYVEGEIDLDGDIRDILSLGDSFCHTGDCKSALTASTRRWWRPKNPTHARTSNITTTSQTIFTRYGWIRAVYIPVPTSPMPA